MRSLGAVTHKKQGFLLQWLQQLFKLREYLSVLKNYVRKDKTKKYRVKLEIMAIPPQFTESTGYFADHGLKDC